MYAHLKSRITERLCDLGFAEDLKWMTYKRIDQFIEHPLVKQPKELTDRSTLPPFPFSCPLHGLIPHSLE